MKISTVAFPAKKQSTTFLESSKTYEAVGRTFLVKYGKELSAELYEDQNPVGRICSRQLSSTSDVRLSIQDDNILLKDMEVS